MIKDLKMSTPWIEGDLTSNGKSSEENRRGTDTERRPCEDGDGDWSDAPTSQGTKREARQVVLGDSKRNQSCRYLDSRCLAPEL